MAQSTPSRRLHRLQEDLPDGPSLLMSPAEVHTESSSFDSTLPSTPRGRPCTPASPCPTTTPQASVSKIQSPNSTSAKVFLLGLQLDNWLFLSTNVFPQIKLKGALDLTLGVLL